jgi:hypothetical protein
VFSERTMRTVMLLVAMLVIAGLLLSAVRFGY